MSDRDERLRSRKKAEATEHDKAEPDWSRMDALADRLLSTKPKPNRQSVGKAVAPKR